jgi:alkanesulfonate monooxygenase SsuD/methylene tetrahydromethanopterin reductase-like flavin-dependent oxidoreductase (luciferase family)
VAQEVCVTALDEIKLYYFHHHHYIDQPEDHERYRATMVDYPNSLYDPVKGHELYERHFRSVVRAEQLGFDGLCLNEHHSMAFSMSPTVSLLAARYITATNRSRIMVAGTPINLMYPNRVAEEYALLDVMSGGRMEYAFPLGTGMEYWANEGTINPTSARRRFRESLDIILKAWTEEGPIRYDGDFYTYRYLNVWPRPYQQPHPKCFIVGTGSEETVQLAVDYGMGYSIVFVPIKNQLRAFARLRELADEQGRTVDPDDLIIVVMAYVADTDEEAVREARPHIENFFSWFHRVTPRFLVPPGYVTTAEFLRRVSDAAMAKGTEATWDDMVSIGRIACGSPDTVAETIVNWCREAGCARVNVVLENGDMPEWKIAKNTTLFANEVIPRIRSKLGQPTEPAGEERELVTAGVK